MILTIDLPPDLQRDLEKAAAAQGTVPSEYILRLLGAHFALQRGDVDLPTVGQRILAQWEEDGALGGAWAERTDVIDAPTFARQLRRQVETRGFTVEDKSEE